MYDTIHWASNVSCAGLTRLMVVDQQEMTVGLYRWPHYICVNTLISVSAHNWTLMPKTWFDCGCAEP